MAVKREPLAFLVQVEERFGSKQLVAHVLRVTDSGELLNPLDSGWDHESPEFADFTVSAYVDREHEHAWGPGHGYADVYRVDYRRAGRMFNVLRKLDKGLDKLKSEQGYLTDGDFCGYLFRVASVLGIRRFYLRNDDKQRAMTGNWCRSTDATGVQMWVSDRERELCRVPSS